MSDKTQLQSVPQDDEQNEKNQPKYTVKLFGRYVPIWVVVLIIIVLLWIVWHLWTSKHKNMCLTSSTRAELNKAMAPTTSNNDVSISAGIPLSTPSTEETRQKLNQLFNSF